MLLVFVQRTTSAIDFKIFNEFLKREWWLSFRHF